MTDDIAPSAVFLFLFIISAVTNQIIYQWNRRTGHKFHPSMLFFAFSMARILTTILRIVWATRQTNVSVAIAANIFVAAGTLLFYIANILFATRILRALRPRLGWHPALSLALDAIYALVAAALVMVIAVTLLSFYTLDPTTRSISASIQRGAGTYLLCVAVLPLPMLGLAVLGRRSQDAQTFGRGGMAAKIAILLVGTCCSIVVAGFRAGTAWEAPRPAADPAWYDHRASFYLFNFTVELVILYLYTFARVDQRFYVPDGSSKVKTYDSPDGRGKSLEEGSVSNV